jgi:hypothetical protein
MGWDSVPMKVHQNTRALFKVPDDSCRFTRVIRPD